MSKEIRITVSLRVRKTENSVVIIDDSLSASFTADMTGTKGPSPGAFTAGLTGTDVDLSALTTPGAAWFENQDGTNFVTWGIYDPETSAFYALGELLPGERYPIRLSRYLKQEFTGTGTSSSTARLRFMADTAPVDVAVKAYEA